MISLSKIYKWGFGIAVGTAIFLFWSNLAVGIIGSEDNPINLMYLGVIAVGTIGFIIARYRVYKMAYTLFATAFAQALVAIIAVSLGLHQASAITISEILIVNGFFVALFLLSGLLFWKVVRG